MAHATIVNRIKHHIWGPTGSVLAHIILVLLLITFINTAHNRAPEDEIFVTLEHDRPPIQIDDILIDYVDEPLDLSQDLVPMPEPKLTLTTMDEPVDSEPVQTLVDMQILQLPTDGVVKMPSLINCRVNRKESLSKHARGFARVTEPAVIRALEWLKKNQKADGSWNDSMVTGHTGLALLTYLAHGETPASRRYGPTIEKAMRYLMQQTDEHGRFRISQKSHSGIYEHCIATYAVAEAYNMTRIPGLRSMMEANLAVIVKGQQAGGGWDYGFADEGRTDSSAMGWAVQALKAGRLAYARTPGLEEALVKAKPAFVALAKPSTGRFGYTSPGAGDIGLTGVGVLSLQMLGELDTPSVLRGLEALKSVEASFTGVSKHPLYAYYYITQARFQHGGELWTSWNPKIATLLAKSQNKDGSWQVGEEGERRGKVYSTTLAALTLQVYYRFLPTTQQVLEAETEVAAEDTDVIITVGDG